MSETPPPDYFAADLEPEQGTTVCRLSGDLTLTSAPFLERSLEGVLRPGLRLVVDLADLEFIDSSGLAALVTLRRRAEREDFTVSVRLASGNVRRALELVGLSSWVDYAGPADAPSTD